MTTTEFKTPLVTALMAALMLVLILAPAPAFARDIWVSAPENAPENGAAAGGNGSAEQPYDTLEAAFAAAQGGDRVLLGSGSYGTLLLRGLRFEPALEITAAPGAEPHADMLRVQDSAGLVISGLNIWPRPEIAHVKRGMVTVGRTSQDIVLSELDIRSRAEADDYLSWDKDTWLANQFGGVRLDGTRITLQDSTIRGVTTALGLKGEESKVLRNTVAGFAKDGIRVFGRGTEIRGNTVKDCVKVNKNHDDALQSWAKRGHAPDVVRDITVAQNRFLEWTGPKDHPLRCSLQGIGLFNGPYENWVIENNLIAVRAWHGMAIGGMSGAVIRNNTVVNIDGEQGRKPWIRLGKASQTGGNVITGNVAMALVFGPELRNLATQKNYRIRYPGRLFEDPNALDYRPKFGSVLMDVPGLRDQVPKTDIDGVARPQGGAPDFGAFERN